MLPQLITDTRKIKNNLERIFKNPLFANIEFRPHFKTHQSLETGRIFRQFGVEKITVSSLPMAEFFATDGWNDIMIAIPLNPAETKAYSKLAAKTDLHLLVDSEEVAKTALKNIKKPVTFHIKCDCGYGRAGIPAKHTAEFDKIAAIFKNQHEHFFGGLVSHFGNTYHGTKEDIAGINKQGIKKLLKLQAYFETEHKLLCPVSIGDTPSLSVYDAAMLNGVEELRPGNFVYYDVMQNMAGHCEVSDIAVALETPVLSLYPERNEVLLHAGAVHLSKESCTMPDGKNGFGIAVRLSKKGIGEIIEGAFVDRLSQEHGILRVQPDFFSEFKPGDTIGILPVHSCLMLDAMK